MRKESLEEDSQDKILTTSLVDPLNYVQLRLKQWFLNQGQLGLPRDIRQHLETFWVVTTEGGKHYWHCAGRGQGCCQASYRAEDSIHNNHLAHNVNNAEVEKPYIKRRKKDFNCYPPQVRREVLEFRKSAKHMCLEGHLHPQLLTTHLQHVGNLTVAS